MAYLHQSFEQRVDPGRLLQAARSIVVVALLYGQQHPLEQNDDPDPARGRTAMYAWGEDYHMVVREKLQTILSRLRDQVPQPFDAKVCVDTAPLLEREWAAAAGIGWIGKNTLALHQELGSYFFLGAIVTTLDIEPDESVDNRCGTCTACLEACPTGAFPAPYEMDASRCISYLTIEHRGAIPPEFHEPMANWIFGCDICQEVCPFNRHAPRTRERRFTIRPPGPQPILDEVLAWSPEDYRRHLKGSAMKRAKLDMLHRNARIAENNTRAPEG